MIGDYFSPFRLQFKKKLHHRIQRQMAACVAMAVFVMSCSGGCQFAPPKPMNFLPWKKDPAPTMPERILAVWSDSVLHQPGQPGVRGFGGRIYFYQTEGSEPVKVDGALAVYVFDADELDPYQQKPIRKFAFTADQFTEHFSGSALGPSYSVWLPWDEVGGEAKRLSMIARFEGRDGGTVISEPVIKLLPGVPKSMASATKNSEQQSPVRVVGHQKQSSEAVVDPRAIRGREIHTIDLPPSFQKYRHSEQFNTAPAPAGPAINLPQIPISAANEGKDGTASDPVAASDLADRNIREAKPIRPPR